jgi:hypothetical protein
MKIIKAITMIKAVETDRIVSFAAHLDPDPVGPGAH